MGWKVVGQGRPGPKNSLGPPLGVGISTSLMAPVRSEEPRSGGPPNQVAALPSGSDVVDWLYHNVEGFTDRREARKYASNLLKAGFIRHTVNKITFSEQCYYIFGDLCGSTCLPSLLALSPG